MKNAFSKSLLVVGILATLLVCWYCFYQNRNCIDPITTYEFQSDGLLISPDSTIAGVTQIAVKVTTLDSLGTTLLDTTLAPGEQVIAPQPSNDATIRVSQQYFADETLVTTEDDNFRTAGNIIVVDVVIRPNNIALPAGFGTCCSLSDLGTPGADASSFTPFTYDWNWLDPNQINLLKITVYKMVSGIATSPVTFMVAYDPTQLDSAPTILGTCPLGSTSGFSNCAGAMTSLYSASANDPNFSIRFFKINPGSDMQIEIIPRHDYTISIYRCTPPAKED